MTQTTRNVAFIRHRWLITLPFAIAGTTALAQGAAPATSSGLASEPSPYYIGADLAFTHDSNVYGVPFGPSDSYLSTSLLAGFDQPISRQRVFGRASVSVNRYQSEDRLDNTSYSLSTGVDWVTIMKLSGNVTANLSQQLAAPTANVASPVQTRNLQKRNGISGVARWGGEALLTLESKLGYSSLDYSAPEYVSAESNNGYGSFGIFYRPGSLTRVGLAVRVDQTRSPQAIRFDDGRFQANETRGRHLDLLTDYNNGSSLSGSARLSYTRQTNSNVNEADFSGITGSLDVGYRATGKIALSASAARNAGFDSVPGLYSQTVATPATPSTTPTPTPTATTAYLYENNRVTDSLSLRASYAATSKISLTAGARYSRARIISSSAVTGSASEAQADVVDEIRGATLSANYAYSRALGFACYVSRDRREVSGAISYGYDDNVASCSAQFIWR